jgi:hypothetical protein
MTYIVPKQCPICRDVFTPIPHGPKRGDTQTCGKRRCRSLLGARRESWRVGMAKAAATLKARRQARIAAKTAERFGVLSDREQAIFQYGAREGYMDGFNTAVHAKKRRSHAA